LRNLQNVKKSLIFIKREKNLMHPGRKRNEHSNLVTYTKRNSHESERFLWGSNAQSDDG